MGFIDTFRGTVERELPDLIEMVHCDVVVLVVMPKTWKDGEIE
jgi:hypothetical protein